MNEDDLFYYATVCSGIEAPSVAWREFEDWHPRFFSEIDPFCSALLKILLSGDTEPWRLHGNHRRKSRWTS